MTIGCLQTIVTNYHDANIPHIPIINFLRLGVNPKLIDSVVLTHCHADHDAGTLQKIMQEWLIL